MRLSHQIIVHDIPVPKLIIIVSTVIKSTNAFLNISNKYNIMIKQFVTLSTLRDFLLAFISRDLDFYAPLDEATAPSQC